MASSFESFRNLDLSRDEVERIGEALKDKEFRKLFTDYIDEIRDPENRKIFQEEITQLEKERGVDVTFINPVAGYVIKTSADGCKKAFINICSNEHIKKPTSSPTCGADGSRGLTWSLPHSLAPPREDLDNKRVRCLVYDVVFHPDTLHLAQNNGAFRNMVNKTACEAIEANFDVKLDAKNLKFPKLQFKGMAQATMIRKASDEKPPEKCPEEQAILDKIYDNIPKPESPRKPKKPVKKDDNRTKYTTPKFTIKHRSNIEMENFTFEKTAKLNTAIPKELVIEINLPMLKSAADITLDVAEKTVQLTSEKPAKYKLSLTLPYRVNQDGGNAKFEKDKKKLIITLPVISKTPVLSEINREDSGVECDSPLSSPTKEHPLIQEIEKSKTPFLNCNIQYLFPDYSVIVADKGIITYTLNVKNVNETSIEKMYDEQVSSMHIKFTSISSGFFPVHYAFYVRLPEHYIEADNVLIEAWDNNVVVQIAFNPCDIPLTKYLVGLSETDTTQKIIEEKNEENCRDEKDVHNSKPHEFLKPKEVQKANIVMDTVSLRDESKSRAIDIAGAYSESSGDELSYSYSPSKCKGILKRISSSRSSVSRSISESSIDDIMWTSSFENCYNSMDSVIPEDGEISSSLKKTVRFNDNVTRQLFRSNSSILGQKKKNQRKAKNKKRAQERRYSESELSECDEKKERDSKTDDVSHKEEQNENEDKKEDNHIFEFDM